MTNHPKFTRSHDSAARKSSSRTATGSRKSKSLNRPESDRADAYTFVSSDQIGKCTECGAEEDLRWGLCWSCANFMPLDEIKEITNSRPYLKEVKQ